jgi:hypothetical protein
MKMVNITEAAKLAGISRNHFYKKYLNPGLISVSKNEAGKVAIDPSELMRVFTTLSSKQMKVPQCDSEITLKNGTSEAVLLEKIKGLETLLKAKEDELESSRDREKYLYHLLESKLKKRKWFGLF